MLGKFNSPTELHPQFSLLYCNCYWLGEETKKGWSFGQHSMLGHDACLLRFWVEDAESPSQGSLCSQEAADYPAKPVFTSYKERDTGTFLKILSLRSIFKQIFTWLRLKTKWKCTVLITITMLSYTIITTFTLLKVFFFCSCFFLSFYCFLLLVQNLFNEKTRKKKGVGDSEKEKVTN